MEHAFKTLGKFLAIASAARVYREVYGSVLSEEIYNSIINDLQVTSDDYLYPKYVVENNNNLLDDVDIIDNNNDVGC